MKKNGYPRLRINGRRIRLRRIGLRKISRRKGSIEWVTGLFFLLFLAILLCAQMQIAIYQSSSLYLEDALAASNLASAVIDLEEYGISHTVRIAEPADAYAAYVRAVKKNLNLDENWECANSSLISGKVTVADYIVYNVEEDAVHIFRVSENGRIHTWEGVPGHVTAPNGVTVTATGVYSELSFPVEGLFGVTVQARKGKLVDIVTEGML